MVANRPLRVLLTGGPGGGKTSAVAKLRDRLTRRGYQTMLVPEAATALLVNSGGYDATWKGTERHVDLQENISIYQMHQEDMFIKMAALRPDKPCVLLCDRGIPDAKLFCTDEEWAALLSRLKQSHIDLLKRYDLVIHMKSIASGMEQLYDYGPGSSNPARYHTPDQAREADLKSQELYAQHPQVRIVENDPSFENKVDTVLNHVLDSLQCTCDGAVAQWERELIPASNVPADNDWPVKYETYTTQIVFLDAGCTESIRRRELSSGDTKSNDDHLEADLRLTKVQFEHRREVHQGDSSWETREVITQTQYAMLHKRCSVEVEKQSICFEWEERHYELSSYSGTAYGVLRDDCGLNGNRVLDRPTGAAVPTFLLTGRDVEQPTQTEASDVSPLANPNDPAKVKPRVLARRATMNAGKSIYEGNSPDGKRKMDELTSPPPKRRVPATRMESPQLSRSPQLSKRVATSILAERSPEKVSPPRS